MIEPSNSQANSGADPAPPPRRPGRPKGVKNRATVEIRSATQKKGAAALRLLWKLCLSKDEKVADAALARWLAYAYGKPVDRQELTGADGQPLHPAPEMDDQDLARLLAFTLTKATKEAGGNRPARPLRTLPEPSPARVVIEEAQRERFADLPEPDPVPLPAAKVIPFPEAAPLPMILTPELLRRHND